LNSEMPKSWKGLSLGNLPKHAPEMEESGLVFTADVEEKWKFYDENSHFK
jgi:hypothetical protein